MMILVYVMIVLMTFSSGSLVGYQHGKKIERAQCLQEQQAFSVEAEQKRRKAEDERLQEKRAYEMNLMRVINDKQKVQAELNQRMHELRTGGLWISAKACAGRNSVPGKTEGASSDDRTAGSGKIRLPDETEGRLLSITFDAQALVAKYNDLRKICLPLVDVVD